MKGYLFDTHVHTKESSSCGGVAAADIVARYKKLGYDGIIITDHVHASQFSKHGETYEEQAKNILRDTRRQKFLRMKIFTLFREWKSVFLRMTTIIFFTVLMKILFSQMTLPTMKPLRILTTLWQRQYPPTQT